MGSKRMWFTLKMIFAAGGISLALYALITDDYSTSPLMQLCVGMTMIAMAFEERAKKSKVPFPVLLAVGLFVIFVGLYIWIV